MMGGLDRGGVDSSCHDWIWGPLDLFWYFYFDVPVTVRPRKLIRNSRRRTLILTLSATWDLDGECHNRVYGGEDSEHEWWWYVDLHSFSLSFSLSPSLSLMHSLSLFFLLFPLSLFVSSISTITQMSLKHPVTRVKYQVKKCQKVTQTLWHCHYAPQKTAFGAGLRRLYEASAFKWLLKTCSEPFPQKHVLNTFTTCHTLFLT